MPTVITYDTENYSSWASREVTTDDRGYLISRTTIYDNGISMTETTRLSEQGFSITRLDLEDVTSWESYTSTATHFSGLSGFTNTTLFDNGILRQDTSVSNFESDFRSLSEDDTADVKNWTSWDKEYYDGRLTEFFIYFDNGVEERNFYSQREGFDDTRVLLDHDDAFNWDVKDFAYNQDGEIQSSTVTFDNGISVESVFDAGILAQSTKVDGADQYRWSEIVTTYEDGQKVAKVTAYDDGVLRTEMWENGLRTQTVREDTTNDKSWESQTTNYDAETGQVALVSTLYDSGVQQNVYNSGGVRRVVEATDTQDAFDWDTKVSFYQPDGTRVEADIQMDNGDRFIFAYQEDDGQRDWRLEVDGDNSHDWAYRVTEYDVDGLNPEVTTYDTIGDLPQPYIDHFVIVLG